MIIYWILITQMCFKYKLLYILRFTMESYVEHTINIFYIEFMLNW